MWGIDDMDAAAGNQGTICYSYYNLVNGYKVSKICKVIPFEFIHISHHPIMCAAPALSFTTEMYSCVVLLYIAVLFNHSWIPTVAQFIVFNIFLYGTFYATWVFFFKRVESNLHIRPFLAESGCLLPSLPSDATFDKSSGISFICDLNDNIPAPWPSSSRLPTQSCNSCMFNW